MNQDSRAMLQKMIERSLTAYLAQVEKQYAGPSIAPRHLAEALKTFVGSPALADFIDESYGKLMDMAAQELLQQERMDAYHRLMVHPLTEAFDLGLLSRDILANYFSFLHLVLGDAESELAEACSEICTQLRSALPDFTWDAFYADLGARRVLWRVLVRIAESFRRFDVRRDWFINLMQNRVQAVSLASNAFIPHGHGLSDKPTPFGPEQFNVLFGDLFGPLRRLGPREAAAFRDEFKAPPEQVLGPLFTQLAAIGAFK